MDTKTIYIYGLFDILDEQKKIQYVGKTKHLRNRLGHHNSSSFAHRPVRGWVESLKQTGSAASMVVLDKTENESEANTLEKQWIQKLSPTYNVQHYQPPIILMTIEKLFNIQNTEILRLLMNFQH